jgi:type IV secretion system protein VirB4
MLRLARIVKNYEEAGALNSQINLYGFLSDQVFLTKSGELGVILEVRGVDYECLDGASIDALSKRLESAFRLFDENYRVYQYLFKRNNPGIPYKLYGNAIVDASILNRIRYLESKSDKLFSLSLYYVVLFEYSRTARTITSLVAEIPERPLEVFRELRAWFSTQKQIVFEDRELSRAESILLQKTRSFLLQVQDFVSVRMVDKQDAFRVLTQILNFAPQKIEHARLKHDTFLDYYVCGSHLECHRGHLRVDDYYVKVFTLKEPSAQSFPLMLKRLLEVEANFYVVTEWKKEDACKYRRVIQASRRSSFTGIILVSSLSPWLFMTWTWLRSTGPLRNSTKSSASMTRNSTRNATTC